MNDLCKTELSFLLKGNSQTVTNEEMHNTYENFLTKVLALNQSENDYSKIFRTLSITRAELASLKSLYQHEQGEKCLKSSLSAKGIGSCQF